MKKVLIVVMALIVVGSCSIGVYANDTYDDGTVQPRGEVGYYWTFSKKSQSKYSAESRTKKVSACYEKGMAAQITSSQTYTASFSSGCPSGVKNKIFSACTISIGKSLTNSKTYSKTNKSKQDAHIIFTPYYVKVTGKAYKRNTLGGILSSKTVTGYYPKKEDGFVDGRFSLEYHKPNKCNR